MYNKVIMMGRLTRDPELKTTPSGVSVCTFSIAVDRRFQNKGEEKKADFFNIVAWRQNDEFVSRYFKKGSMILDEGALQTRSYTNKDGQTVNLVPKLSLMFLKELHPNPIIRRRQATIIRSDKEEKWLDRLKTG